jgi:Protein of unknown function (DUF3987)/BT4734-like, N-terminal domain
MSAWTNAQPKPRQQACVPIKISMVKCATDNETRDISVEKVFEAIRTGGKNLKSQIQQIRNRFEAEMAFTSDRKKAKLAVDPLKKQLPGVMWSGTFSQRANDKLMKHSGLLCADLDSLGAHLIEIRKKLEASPHAVAVFLSPSGDGLKVSFRVAADASRHAGSFGAVEKHVRDLTGIQIDQACKDPARLCFMSHDPQLYINLAATQIEPLPEPVMPKLIPSNGTFDLSERQHIAQRILGSIEWISQTEGYCDCPNKAAHTTGDGKRDCKIWVGDKPTIYCFHNSCRGVIDGLNHALRSRVGRAEKSSVDVDEAEIELPPTPAPYVPPPLDLLPIVLRDYVQTSASCLDVDESFVFLPLLASLGATIGNSRSILLKRDFVQPPVIWTAIIGRSGCKKSPSIDAGSLASMEHEHELRRQNKEVNERYDDEVADWESASKKLRGRKPEKPVLRVHVTDDLTIETLADLHAANPRGLLVRKDEVSHWFASFDQYKSGKGSDVARWLTLHTAVFFAVDRRSDDRHYRIFDPRVCITGGIQPAVLQRVLTPDFFERGLPARFLFAHPSFRQDKWSDATIPAKLKLDALRLFDSLWLLAPRQDNGRVAPELLTLAPEAKAAFVAFYNATGRAMCVCDDREGAAWSKLTGYAARLALIGQLAHDPDATTICGEVMQAAVTLTQWFGHEAERIYFELSETDEQREERRLIECIERHGGTVTVRDVMRSMHYDKEQTERALNALLKKGIALRVEIKPEGRGRPTVKFRLIRQVTVTQLGKSPMKTGNCVTVTDPNSEKITSPAKVGDEVGIAAI